MRMVSSSFVGVTAHVANYRNRASPLNDHGYAWINMKDIFYGRRKRKQVRKRRQVDAGKDREASLIGVRPYAADFTRDFGRCRELLRADDPVLGGRTVIAVEVEEVVDLVERGGTVVLHRLIPSVARRVASRQRKQTTASGGKRPFNFR